LRCLQTGNANGCGWRKLSGESQKPGTTMDTKAAINTALSMSKMISTSYLGDLTDEEMMHRPSDGCNHIKWQVGHLIASENNIINECFPDSMPALPAGFAEKYTKETATSNDAAAFDSKDELLRLHDEQRAGTLALLEKVSDQELSKENTGPIKDFAPTVGAAFLMQDAHWLMHAGQWAVIRRQLGRAPLF
jgi:hypothetical protein